MSKNPAAVNRKSKFSQGFFKPKYPEKYKGDPTQIIYRSSWELIFMHKLDTNPHVLQWSSEGVVIPYPCPLTPPSHGPKTRRYFVDFWVRSRNKTGGIDTTLIEVKPHKEVIGPDLEKAMTKKGKPRVSYLRESKTYAVNQTKWTYAEAFCKKRGWKFEIVTEFELGLKKPKGPAK